MKKTVALILLITVLLGGCTAKNKENQSSKDDKTGSQTTQSQKELQQQDNQQEKPNTSNNQPIKIENNNGVGNEHGFYYLNTIDNEKNIFSNIMYLDYASNQEIVLCNKPNCKHDHDSCNAYANQDADSNYLFLSGNNLYLQTTETGLPIGQPIICKYNLDGTNKTKIFELDSGMTLMKDFVIRGNDLYCTARSIKVSNSENGEINFVQDDPTQQNLIKIDLTDKKYETVVSMKNRNIIGTYKNSIVIKEMIFPEGFNMEEKNHAKFMEGFDNATAKFILFDVDSKKESEIYSGVAKRFGDQRMSDNKIIFFSKSNTIEYIDIDTKQEGVLIDDLKKSPLVIDVRDNKVIYGFWEDKKVNAMMETYYYVDMNTKENKQINLMIPYPKQSVNIVSETKDSFLVISGFDAKEEYISGYNVYQPKISKTHYSLIKKNDYFNSNANYVRVNP